jgi:NAD(P)-dependent dehydrogenase (short-subunit alcohol dehydrogenase family)
VSDIKGPAELFGLDGKVVIVTGASSGLGAQWCPVLAAAGAQVVLAARREAELAEVAATAVGSIAIPADVTSGEDRQRLFDETIRRFGRVDVLINNAGVAASSPALDTTVDDFRSMLDADLTSLFALSQLVGRAMVDARRGGSIINISSLGAERSLDRYPLPAYNAAKAGVVALTRSLASEWGRHAIRVNAIGPAFFPTATAGYLQDPEQVEWVSGHTALKRPARIDELDGLIVFLASDASTFITGQHLLVDGGWSVY